MNLMNFKAFLNKYTGASLESRALRMWIPSLGSANVDFPDNERRILVARSRDAYRNQPLAKAVIDRISQLVIGHGASWQSDIDRDFLNLNEEEATKLETHIERCFNVFSNECVLSGNLSLNQFFRMLMASWLISGDVFVSTPYQKFPGDLMGLKLQGIESDRVCNPNFTLDTATIKSGIEYKNGRISAYHVLKTHPFDLTYESLDWTWERIENKSKNATRFMHLYSPVRPGQVRGVPFLAPVLETLKQIDAYNEAELAATVVSSLFTIFVTTENSGNNYGNLQQNAPAGVTNKEIPLKSGSVVGLSPGEKIETADPKRPNSGYKAFIDAQLEQIGAALSIPSECILERFNSSYSASRAAMSVAEKEVKVLRSDFTANIGRPIVNNFMDELVARNLIQHDSLKDYFNDPLIRNAWQAGTWTFPAQIAIDSEKEVRASKAKIDLGVSTIQHECAELGTGDWLSNHRQRQHEHKLRIEAGLEQNILAGAGSVVRDSDVSGKAKTDVE